ncbi:MAG TPA: hypothetical protein VG456_08305 [Candidatus Sulfopaludibacter sp.]|jgi:hypothetical protein|nr:hypothetical protein [Candidatus Sulfopaludibacter sp.]
MVELILAAAMPAQHRTIESVLPGLRYSGECTSAIDLTNLSRRVVQVEVEGHRNTGGLVALGGQTAMQVELAPLAHTSLRLVADGSFDAWVKVRETVPEGASASVAVQATAECLVGSAGLRAVIREPAFATANPWFSGDAAGFEGAEIALINSSDAAVTATGCYSSGSLVSNPGRGGTGELTPVCSESFHVQIPPFGARNFPVQIGSATHFALHTEGRRIVLLMMRPMDASVHLFKVDSTIQFGAEVPAGK